MKGSQSNRISRPEWSILILLLLVGALLRLWSPGRIAVEHFDEGVYSSNQLLSDPQYGFPRYPFRELYAPPLVPYLSQLFRSWQPILPGLITGILTIPAVWWLARIWFGPLSGLMAATLATFSDFHILYSRTILTDVPMGFFLVLSVTMISLCYLLIEKQSVHNPPSRKKKKSSKKPKADEIKSPVASFWILAGVLTSLCWWTKYNGWLPIAIAFSGLLPWLIFNRTKGSPWGMYLLTWGVISFVAWLLWLPVLSGLSDVGGYAAVAENHRGYLVGIANWGHSLVRQYRNHIELDGGLSVLSLLLITLIPVVWDRLGPARNDKSGSDPMPLPRSKMALIIGTGIYLSALAAFQGTSLTLVILCLIGGGMALWLHLFKRNETPADSHLRRSIWLLMAWFVGLAISTPFYRAYPRLTLPWLIACWIGVAGFASFYCQWIGKIAIVDPDQKDVEAQNLKFGQFTTRKAIFHFCVMTVLLVFLFLLDGPGKILDQGVPGWEDRTALKKISEQITSQIQEPNSEGEEGVSLIALYGQPAICFHVGVSAEEKYKESGRVIFAPMVIGDLGSFLQTADRREGKKYLVISRKALESEISSDWERFQNRFEEVGKYAYPLSKLVSLNEFSPSELAEMEEPPVYEILLFRVR